MTPTPTVHIGLVYNGTAPPGIAVMPVIGPNGDSVQEIIRRDLENSDRFNVVPLDQPDPKAYRDTSAAGGLNYPLFKALNVRAVVQITPTAAGLHVTLHDVDSAWVIASKDYPLSSIPLSRDWRFAIHVISDAIEEPILGRRGIAATRIAYIRGGSLRLVDSDGAGDIAIPSDSSPYCPAWSPDGKTIAYNTFGTSKIMTVDLATGHARTMTPYARDQTILGPQFTPNGDSIAYFRTDGNASRA